MKFPRPYIIDYQYCFIGFLQSGFQMFRMSSLKRLWAAEFKNLLLFYVNFTGDLIKIFSLFLLFEFMCSMCSMCKHCLTDIYVCDSISPFFDPMKQLEVSQ